MYHATQSGKADKECCGILWYYGIVMATFPIFHESVLNPIPFIFKTAMQVGEDMAQ